MSKDTTSAAGEGLPATVDLNAVQSDVWHLYYLLDATMTLLHDMPYVRNGERDVELERVASLAWFARDHAERLGKNIDENFHHIQTGARS